MAITINLPPELERELRLQFPDLEARVLIVICLDLYRCRLISATRLADLLGAGATEASNVLVASGTSTQASEFRFHDGDLARFDSLATKSNEGTLTPAEAADLRALVELDASLSALRAGGATRRQTDAA